MLSARVLDIDDSTVASVTAAATVTAAVLPVATADAANVSPQLSHD